MYPIIAVACNLDFYSDRDKVSVNQNYTNALIDAGGVPVLMPVTEDEAVLGHAMSSARGLLLPGGIDIYPRLYDREPAPNLGSLNPELDRFQLAVLRIALDRDLPVLGICRGEQILNVAFGGTLIQHIPTDSDHLQHCQDMNEKYPTHSVKALEGSKIAKLLGTAFDVNSFHHQAVERLGEGLTVTATAPDGIIEAFEHTELPFVVGVQWHPEGLIKGDRHMEPLFEAFVRAADAAW